jgi:hypothetical protein
MSNPTPSPVGATFVVALSNGNCLKVSRASRMSDLAERMITALSTIGGWSAAFLEALRRWPQRRRG